MTDRILFNSSILIEYLREIANADALIAATTLDTRALINCFYSEAGVHHRAAVNCYRLAPVSASGHQLHRLFLYEHPLVKTPNSINRTTISWSIRLFLD